MNIAKINDAHEILIARTHTVDEIKAVIVGFDFHELERLKLEVGLWLDYQPYSLKCINYDKDKLAYGNLLLRVFNDAQSPQTTSANMLIMDAQVNLVPVTWVDDGTTDAETNANVLRWVELNMVHARHLAVAKETNAAALHLFEPRAMNRRTAHVTTESFIRIMEKSK